MRVFNPITSHPQLAGVLRPQHHEASGLIMTQSATTSYVLPGWSWDAVVASQFVPNGIYFTPILINAPMTITGLTTQIITASSGGANIRMGLYDSLIRVDGTIYPDALLAEGGAIQADATGYKTSTIDVDVTAGVYWVVIGNNGSTAPICNSIDYLAGFSMPFTSGQSVVMANRGKDFVITTADGADNFANPAASGMQVGLGDTTTVMIRFTSA